MLERAVMCGGSFNIDSKSKEGTIVTLTVPLEMDKENQIAI